jgi:hypothetical protein
LAQAFAKAKAEFRPTGLSGTNAHQKYEYARIADIYSAVEDSLLKNNIIIWHFSKVDSGGLELFRTRLIHILSGQFIEDERILESEKPGNQGKGAANTYMKKYALLSLCAIPTEDDDWDEEQRYIEKRANEPAISKEQIEELQAAIKTAANGRLLYGNILKFNKVQDLSQLKSSSFISVKSYIANNKE